MSSDSNSKFKLLQNKLDLLTSSDHSEPQRYLLQDHNRNAVIGISSLARLSEMNTKTILTEHKYLDLMFIFGRHVTFNDTHTCLSQLSDSYWDRTAIQGIDRNKLFGMPTLNNCSYFAEHGKSSYWFMNSVKKMNLLTDLNVNKHKQYIGHTIGLGVRVDPLTRKPKELTSKFKKYSDNIWNNQFPPQLKSKYFELKTILSNHMNSLNEIKKNNDMLLYSYKMQLRYIDEDLNHHLNYRSYFKMVEESLMNYDINMSNNKYLNYSMSVVYWKETAVNKYNYCFVNICKKKDRVIKNDRKNESYIGWDFFGLISICKCCERENNIRYDECHEHEWVHQSGFVVTVIANKQLSTHSKL